MDFFQNQYFQDLNENERSILSSNAKDVELQAGQTLFNEGDEGESFFLIVEGEVEILKKGTSLVTLKEGDILGEMASIGEHRRTATAKAKLKTRLKEVSLEELSESSEGKALGEKIRDRFSSLLKERVETASYTAVSAIQKQLEHEQARSHLGNTLIYLLLAIFIYIFAIKSLNLFNVKVISSTVISVPILIVFACFMLLLIKKAGYPWSDYGFTLKNWGKHLFISFLWTIPVLVGIFLFKWVVIEAIPSFQNLHVISISPSLNQGVVYTPTLFIVLVIAYLIFVPVQEIIYRGALQTILEKLLLSPHKTLVAILISNLPFSLIHLHLSFTLTLFVYFFGLFWGWMFAYQRSLVGCIFSHVLIGFWAFFILGIQDILPS